MTHEEYLKKEIYHWKWVAGTAIVGCLICVVGSTLTTTERDEARGNLALLKDDHATQNQLYKQTLTDIRLLIGPDYDPTKGLKVEGLGWNNNGQRVTRISFADQEIHCEMEGGHNDQ